MVSCEVILNNKALSQPRAMKASQESSTEGRQLRQRDGFSVCSDLKVGVWRGNHSRTNGRHITLFKRQEGRCRSPLI